MSKAKFDTLEKGKWNAMPQNDNSDYWSKQPNPIAALISSDGKDGWTNMGYYPFFRKKYFIPKH